MFLKGLKFVLITVVLSSLAACEGDVEGGTTSVDDTTGLLPGVYEAELNQGNDAEESNPIYLAFVSPTGAMVIVEGLLGMTLANIEFDKEGEASGSAITVRFNENVSQWLSFESVLDGVSSGGEKATITITSGINADGATETYSFARENEISNEGVTLGHISGIYTNSGNGGIVTTVTIDSDGSVTGADVTGCVFEGELDIPDSSTNVFEVSYIASNCEDAERNGEFFGLGSLDLSEGLLLFGGTNGEIAAVFEGRR